MSEAIFAELDGYLGKGDQAGGLDFLVERFRSNKDFHLFFEAKLMKKRLELGLPLIQSQSSAEFPAELRPVYESAMVEVARETGGLILKEGDIARAWPYFRAIGEVGPVAEAIDRIDPEEAEDDVIQIAFQEGVHSVKGLEMVLQKHGMCRAITVFGMYAVEKGRADCIRLLARGLHGELMERMLRAVESQEGARPEAKSIRGLFEERDWLFGEYDYYVDTSHLYSLLPYSLDAKDAETLELFHDLCAYGKKLSPMFQSKGQSPFDQPFVDYDEYLLAVMGDDVDARIRHFRKKAEESDPEEVGTAPAQLLVNLLVRLGRPEEALQVSMELLAEEESMNLSCPSTLQLCSLAKDYERLRNLARMRGDLLSYVAATA